ncbi:MAG: class I SAM-dependent methyltransferase [Thermoplasmata archaeon]|nr:class I SAM-dependent methyltransferase [Thermoplasmata archaeon]
MNANEAILLWVDEYSRMAEAYDQNVAPRFEPIAAEVLRLADPKPNELFLDIGTGTGLLACMLAPRVLPQGVVAIDLADGAISVASYRAGNAGIRNIRFEMLDSRNIVYRGKLFDGVASNLGIPNAGHDRVFQEVHRVLKPGGRFVFSEWPTEFPAAFAVPRELLEKHGTPQPSKELAQLREARRIFREDREGQLLGNPTAVRKALSVGGFDSANVATKEFRVRFPDPDALLTFAASFGWCDRELRELTPESRTAFDLELKDGLQDRETTDGIEDTWTVHFYVARKE